MSTETLALLDSDPAAGIRATAALMRERAEAASSSGAADHEISVSTFLPAGTDDEAAAAALGYTQHLAHWHPAVALAVADLLDRVANDYAIAQHGYWSVCALAVARAYLGEAS